MTAEHFDLQPRQFHETPNQVFDQVIAWGGALRNLWDTLA